MIDVEVRGVSKRFGRIAALSDLTVEIPRGCVCAVVGPNGSGKSTLFAAIAGLVVADAGTINLWQKGPFDAGRWPGRLALMPQDSAPSPHSSIGAHLQWYGRLQGMSLSKAREQAEHWLSAVELSGRFDAKFAQLSHGMKRRFSIAQALLGTPRLVLLDEPLSGLDPQRVSAIRSLISNQREGKTLLVSSHNLGELQAMCDYVVVLDSGRAVYQGSMAAFLGVTRQVTVSLAGELNEQALVEALPSGFVWSWRAPELSVEFPRELDVAGANAKLLHALLSQGAGVLSLREGASLEASYLKARTSANSSCSSER